MSQEEEQDEVGTTETGVLGEWLWWGGFIVWMVGGALAGVVELLCSCRESLLFVVPLFLSVGGLVTWVGVFVFDSRRK